MFPFFKKVKKILFIHFLEDKATDQDLLCPPPAQIARSCLKTILQQEASDLLQILSDLGKIHVA